MGMKENLHFANTTCVFQLLNVGLRSWEIKVLQTGLLLHTEFKICTKLRGTRWSESECFATSVKMLSTRYIKLNQPSCRRMVASLQGNGLQKLSLYLFLSVLGYAYGSL